MMKNRVLGLSLLMAMSVPSFAENTSVIEALKSKPNWGLIQPGTMCIEHYRFLSNREILIQSNQQRVTGTYSFISNENAFELPAIVIHFETDNRKSDCSGIQADQSGTSTTNYLKRESNQKIFFCLDALGKNCPVYLRPEN